MMNLLSVSGVVILLLFEVLALMNYQKLMKLLVFSTIAEVGYIMLGAGAGTFAGESGAMLHLEYQVIMRGLVFIAAAAITMRGGSQSIEKLVGMGRKSPFLATFFAFGAFSVMGLSPFKGSVSKFLIVYSNIEIGNYLFAALAILGSVIEAWYFIRIIQRICFEEGTAEADTKGKSEKKPAALSNVMNAVIVLLGTVTALASLFPETMIEFAGSLAGSVFGYAGNTELPVFDTPWPMLVLVPYVGAFAVFIIGHFIPKLRGALAVAVAAATVYLVWMDGSIDGLSRIFTLIISFIVLMAVIYSIGYFKGKSHNNRYFFFILLTLGSLIGVATSTQFGNFYVFWELMTWASYLLVIHEPTEKALKAGFKYFMMCTTGAYFMQFGILLLHNKLGTFDMASAAEHLGALTPGVLIAIAAAFIIGTGVKAGLFPMHSWLPAAHPAAQSPVSSLLSGILTKIGIYGLIRVLFAVFGIGLLTELGSYGKLSTVGLVISIMGIITLLYGEVMALLQTDIKRLLAYSTMAQIGEIVTTLGIGTYLSLVAGLFHVMNHAIMKGMLFLAVGILIHTLHTQEIVKLKGIGKKMPVTCGCLSIGILAIMGLPPFNGFVSKFMMLYASIEAGVWYYAAFMLLGGVIGAIYYIKLIRTVFFEKYEGPADVKEAPLVMLIPVMILTGLAIFNGLFPQPALNLVKAAADAVAAQGGIAVTAIPNVAVAWPVMIIIPMLGGLITYFLGKRSPKVAGWTAVAVMTATLAGVLAYSANFDVFSLTFAVLIAAVGIINLLYSLGYMAHGHAQSRYYMFFIMMIGGLIGVATSSDFFTFFIFWEVMSSWSLYFVIIHEETQDSLNEGFKYFIFNYIGASIALMGTLVVTVKAGTFDMAALAHNIGGVPLIAAVSGVALMAIGFLMKGAVLPFRIDYQMHPATAPTPVSGYISSVLLKSSPFWLIKLFFILGGAAVFGKVLDDYSFDLMNIVSWIAGLTIVGAAAMAILQNGLKRLLIYSTVSQIGYIILGLSLGSTLGVSGGMLHFVNHMFFKDLLFLCAGAIMVQAHAHNLNEVGGLGRKMPFTMVFFMVGALSLAGIPPFSGFTSKWLIYEAAMQQGQVVLALLSLAGSVLSMAYFLKFMHSAFFGILPKKMENVKEAPWTMLVPMGILSVLSIVCGFVPGLPLTVISKAMALMNIEQPDFTMFGVSTPLGAWQVGVVLILMVLGALLAYLMYATGSKKVRYTSAYTCGVSDISDDEMHIASNNLYESPCALVKKIDNTVVIPVFGNGEEEQK